MGALICLPLWYKWLEIWAQLGLLTIWPTRAFSSMEILRWSDFTHVAQGSKSKCSHKQRGAVEPFRHIASLLLYPTSQSNHRPPRVKMRGNTSHFDTSAKEFAVMF